MKLPESSEKNHQHFFANTTDYGFQASFSDAKGRKNYRISKAKQIKEEAPLAIESFAMTPEQYHTLMERVNRLYN